MNRFMTRDLMVAVLPGGESTMACDGETTDEDLCDGETTDEDLCDGETTDEYECDGETTDEYECDGETTEDFAYHDEDEEMDYHYRGAGARERDYELLEQELDTVLEGW